MVMNATAAIGDPARFRLLYDLGCAFAGRIEIDELLPLVLEKCRTALDAEGATILLLDAERGDLEFSYNAAEAPELNAKLMSLRVPADSGIAGAVLRSGRAERIEDAHADSRFYTGVDRATGATTRGLLCVPLATRNGTIGVLQVVNRCSAGVFSDDDLGFLEALAGSVAIAIDNARLYARVKADEERLRTQVGVLRRDLARREGSREIIGTASAMVGVFRLMDSAAASPIAVLIEGETGTGKELVARGIHRRSGCADGPFIAVNCAAFSETLLESELFGHRRGAFTGAMQDKRGFFEAASGGTLFLDEVGEMPAAMQAKLLRVLQEGEIVPVGDTRPRKVDVRIISATNRNLRDEVVRKTFREDLFYRLAAFPIRLPALRDRRADVPLLVNRILRAAAGRHGKQIPGIDPEALEGLVAHSWPGNVRELENELERAVALALSGETIGLEHLSDGIAAASGEERVIVREVGAEAASTTAGPLTGAPSSSAGVAPEAGVPLRRARTAFEVRFIADALGRNGGHVTRTAQALGLSRVMLQKKMKEFGLRHRSE
jgi:Nif-specific regulatory protein